MSLVNRITIETAVCHAMLDTFADQREQRKRETGNATDIYYM
jgi:hypothetical protein